MITTQQMVPVEQSDSDLVAQCLAGNRDAFSQIVERYKSLICSLAYSATGSLGQSEDLAQETFLAAWQGLAGLRDPAKLRAWLCGIARCLIGKALRRSGREPVHAAAPLEEVEEGAEPTPVERVITREEEAILWRAIERIPEIYREPLVLFYREHQSVERVAGALDLTEDAVKQRLVRGRRLLQDQVLAFVAGALKGSGPGKAFTLGVLAAIPTIGIAASATAATTAAAKGSSTAAGAGSLAIIGAVISWGVICFFSVLGFLGFVGGCVGWMMAQAARQSVGQCHNAMRFWRILALGFAAFMVPGLSVFWIVPRDRLHPVLWTGLRGWITLVCPVLLFAVLAWGWRWWRDLPQEQHLEPPEVPLAARRQLTIWNVCGVAVPLALLALSLFGIFFESTWRSERISAAEAEMLLGQHPNARVWILQLRNGSNLMRIKLPGESRFISYETTADAHTLEALKQTVRIWT